MRQVVVRGADHRVIARAGAVEIEQAGAKVGRMQPQTIEAMLFEGDVQLTNEARRLLLRAGVELAFCDARGRFLGRLCPAHNRGAAARVAQAKAAADPALRLSLARAIVGGKLANQRVSVARIARSSPSEAAADALVSLRASARRAELAPNLDALRGVEGAAARVVFGVFGSGLKHPAFSFTRRSRRPPRDPVNAVLSFLYTLLTVEVDQAVRAAGLDPGVGFLHETGRGRPACALDLCEEWRPLVDGLVLSLFNRRQLQPGDFCDPTATLVGVAAPIEAEDEAEDEPYPLDVGDAAADDPAEAPADPADDEGPPLDGALDGRGDPSLPAVYLSRFGRRVVLAAWRARLGERLRDPTVDAAFELRELIRLQARRLASTLCTEAPCYTPFTTR
jgi:CRISPR-associated protein Cas1